jgi:hypothetical protein
MILFHCIITVRMLRQTQFFDESMLTLLVDFWDDAPDAIAVNWETGCMEMKCLSARGKRLKDALGDLRVTTLPILCVFRVRDVSHYPSGTAFWSIYRVPQLYSFGISSQLACHVNSHLVCWTIWLVKQAVQSVAMFNLHPNFFPGGGTTGDPGLL